jgi:hypothetical protein
MLSSITPLGERGRHNRFATTAAFFVAGSMLGGAAIGAVSGGVGSIVVPDAPMAIGVVLVVAAAAGVVLDARVWGLRVPTITRQVDENWLHKYRGWVYGFGFGAQLGAALTTIASSSAVYLMLVAAAVSRSMAGGLAIGLVFGTLRGLSIVLAARIDTVDELRRFHRRLAGNASRSVRAGVVAQGLSAVVAVVALVGAR